MGKRTDGQPENIKPSPPIVRWTRFSAARQYTEWDDVIDRFSGSRPKLTAFVCALPTRCNVQAADIINVWRFHLTCFGNVKLTTSLSHTSRRHIYCLFLDLIIGKVDTSTIHCQILDPVSDGVQKSVKIAQETAELRPVHTYAALCCAVRCGSKHCCVFFGYEYSYVEKISLAMMMMIMCCKLNKTVSSAVCSETVYECALWCTRGRWQIRSRILDTNLSSRDARHIWTLSTLDW